MERYKSEIRDNFRVLSNWLRFTWSESGNLYRTHSACLAERVQERVRNAFRNAFRNASRRRYGMRLKRVLERVRNAFFIRLLLSSTVGQSLFRIRSWITCLETNFPAKNITHDSGRMRIINAYMSIFSSQSEQIILLRRGYLASFENRKFCIKWSKFLHKIKQNRIAKKYRYIGIIGIFFSGIGFRGFFQIPQQPTVRPYKDQFLGCWSPAKLENINLPDRHIHDSSFRKFIFWNSHLI